MPPVHAHLRAGPSRFVDAPTEAGDTPLHAAVAGWEHLKKARLTAARGAGLEASARFRVYS